MNNASNLLATAGILLAVAIGLGAFGAHALDDILTLERQQTWQTAVQYHMWNALGLLAIALTQRIFNLELIWATRLILAGLLIFSGSLYILCLSGIGFFGAITPIGGVALIAGWIIFGVRLARVTPS